MFYVSTILADNIFITDTTDNVIDNVSLLLLSKLGKTSIIKGVQSYENPAVCTVREVSGLELMDDSNLMQAVISGNAVLPKFDISGKVLSKVQLPEKIRNCQVLRVPFGVEAIENFAFDWSCENVTTVILPPTIKKLETSAFSNLRNLRSFNIPHSLVQIEDAFFASLRSVETIQIDEGCTSFKMINNGLYSGDGQVFYRYVDAKDVTEFVMLDTVTKICPSAFAYSANLKTLVLSKSLKEIGRGAFAGLSIESIQIPEGVTRVSPYMFGKCVKLKHISLPNSLRTIGDDAFNGCSALEELRLPPYMTDISKASLSYDGRRVNGGVLYGCSSLKKVYIPKAMRITNRNKYKRLGVSEATTVVTY